MVPSLEDGDLLITKGFAQLKIEDLVILRLPGYGYVVKTIKSLSSNSLILKADNKRQDSPLCGIPIALEKVDSKVWFRIRMLNWKRFCRVFITFTRRFKQWIIDLPFLA